MYKILYTSGNESIDITRQFLIKFYLINSTFDWKYYIDIYPDLQKAGINTEPLALRHWNNYGKSEGRSCINPNTSNIKIPKGYSFKRLINNYPDTNDAAILEIYYSQELINHIRLETLKHGDCYLLFTNSIPYSLLLRTHSKTLIDGIIYINLTHRIDRKVSILGQLDGFFNVLPIRLDATYNKERGYIGCCDSHIRAIQLAKKLNFRTVIIVEDDFIFKSEKQRLC